MICENERPNGIEIDLPYERFDKDEMRNPVEAYRKQHFPKPPALPRSEIGRLMKEAKVKRTHTVRSILFHCYSVDNALNSLEALKRNCKEYWQ